ncbi:hypothetical protein [Saccharopolyspora spinosa]|uniref:hypothetical protein n=1 Tax=Saccharopolyspora spinosa TaxID=60894 RepID=UPI000237B705|nr:hypothetical protein [Saccharopolyspora spinosa]
MVDEPGLVESELRAVGDAVEVLRLPAQQRGERPGGIQPALRQQRAGQLDREQLAVIALRPAVDPSLSGNVRVQK